MAKNFLEKQKKNKVMVKETPTKEIQKSSGKGYGERKKLVICLRAGQGIWRGNK